jgi:FkbM family methyltransferase
MIDNKKRIIPSLVKCFDKLLYLPKWGKLDKVIMQHASNTDRFFFIEIGSNDGMIHDPLYQYVGKYKWTGILVEPVSCYFNRLKRNYSNSDKLIFENVAISDKVEIREFYRIEEISYLPTWCKGLGSFYRDILLKHKWVIPDIEDYIVEEKVQCISFQMLLEKHGVSTIDLLMIDTEGYDYEIIKQIDFKGLKPNIIMYEHKHLRQPERKDCKSLLRSNGYLLTRFLSNTLAYLADQ